MRTVSKVWGDNYLKLGQVNPKCPLDNWVIKKTMRPSEYKEHAKMIAKRLSVEDSVLEIGCGFGGLAQEILNEIQVSYTVVDNEPMLAQARKFLGDKVEYVEAGKIETLQNREFELFISNFCLSETPPEYREYILENIIKNCLKISITDLNDTVDPTPRMLKDGYEMVPLGIEKRLEKYFVIKKTKTRRNQSMYIGERRK